MQVSGFPTTTRAGLISTAASGQQNVATLTGAPYAGPGLAGCLTQNGDGSNGSVGWALAASDSVDTAPQDAPPGSSTCFKRVAAGAVDGTTQTLPVLPNTVMTAGAYLHGDGTNGIQVAVTYLNNAGTVIGTEQLSPSQTVAAWALQTVALTTPGNCVNVRLSLKTTAASTFYAGRIGLVAGSTYTDAMFSSNPLGNKSLVAVEATTNLIADGDCEGVGGTTTSVLFNDPFATANAWSTVSGGAPTAAANVLTVPLSSWAAAGHPDWWDTQDGAGTSSSRVRYQQTTGAVQFYPLFVDQNNNVLVALTNTQVQMSKDVAGTSTTLSTVAATLTAGTNYWLTWTRSGTTITVHVCADGATPGAVLYTVTGTVADAALQYGKIAFYASGAAVQLGQMGGTAYSGVCQVSGPTPSSWSFGAQAGSPAGCWSKAQSFSGSYSLSVYNNNSDAVGLWQVSSGTTVTSAAVSGRLKTVGIVYAGNNGFAGIGLANHSYAGITASGTQDWTAVPYLETYSGVVAPGFCLRSASGLAYADALGFEVNKAYATLNLDPFPAFYVASGTRAAAYASIPTPAAVTPSGQWTVAVTVRPKVPQASTPTQFVWGESVGYIGLNLGTQGLKFSWGITGSAQQAYTPGTTYRVVLVFNNGTGSGYVNGSLVGTSTSVQQQIGASLYIGNFGGFDNADADISGLTIENHAWSAPEVAADFVNPNPPGLISGGGLFLQPGMLYCQTPDASGNSLALPAPTAGRTSSDTVHAGVARVGSVQPLPGQTTVGIQGATFDAAGLLQAGGLKKLAGQAIGIAQTAVAHGLDRIPNLVMVKPKSNGVVWESAAADITNVYLTASVAATVDLYVA